MFSFSSGSFWKLGFVIVFVVFTPFHPFVSVLFALYMIKAFDWLVA